MWYGVCDSWNFVIEMVLRMIILGLIRLGNENVDKRFLESYVWIVFIISRCLKEVDCVYYYYFLSIF